MNSRSEQTTNGRAADKDGLLDEVDIIVTMPDGRRYLMMLPKDRLQDAAARTAFQALLSAAVSSQHLL